MLHQKSLMKCPAAKIVGWMLALCCLSNNLIAACNATPPVEFQLRGEPIPPTTSLHEEYTVEYWLKNNLTKPYPIYKLSRSNNAFTFSNRSTCVIGAVIAPGEHCRLYIDFTPTELGKISADITVNKDRPPIGGPVQTINTIVTD